MGPVQHTKPKRREIEARARYQLYREELREDFNKACGYCDDGDEFLDRICFHIDHFAPKKRFPARATTYTNLIYACRFCNIKKSNHWISDDADTCNDGVKGFCDPCSEDYDSHLERADNGRILAKTDIGSYMRKHLNLGLLRHELLWKSRQARRVRREIDALLEVAAAKGVELPEEMDLLRRYRDLTKKIEQYEAFAAG